MAAEFRIHPAIGIARVGNSPTEFYLAPEEEGALPIDCDAAGNPIVDHGREQPIKTFKDAEQRVKRQAARFRVFLYDENNPAGREVQIGDAIQSVDPSSGQLLECTVADIAWTVYLANKKASWYEFKELEGEHGYGPNHPLRNPEMTTAEERQRLIIDPGPRTVFYADPNRQTADFSADGHPGIPMSFPPPLDPDSITTLGALRCTQVDGHNRLLVLGGFGHSGSMKAGFGHPKIEAYANNNGWFDDVSDGPVRAQVICNVTSVDKRPPPPGTPPINVEARGGAWVIIGYPRFAPQIVDIVTMNDAIGDVAVRQLAYEPLIYGVPPFDGSRKPPLTDADLQAWRRAAQWNPGYRPYFWRDIWPIIKRPNDYQWVMDFAGGDPHDTAAGADGNFDPDELSIPPQKGGDPVVEEHRRQKRLFIYAVLRTAGGENCFDNQVERGYPNYRPIAMPYLCGDNPLSNTLPSKFLRLTDTMLFLLRQWADGQFINERLEQIAPGDAKGFGAALDRGVLSNLLGGSFCPGGEASWIVRNLAIYSAPYRIRHSTSAPVPGSLSLTGNLSDAPDTVATLADGLEPGDLTKYSAVPWQSDFNECSTQDIDITYEEWNTIYPQSTGDPIRSSVKATLWWPSHRPMLVFATPQGPQVKWTNIPTSDAGDLLMVRAWWWLGFIKGDPVNGYVQVERNPGT
jgi:L-Lysine epsilon oxidase N-terminal/L-lysine epsilon oxidase C-terminal domain